MTKSQTPKLKFKPHLAMGVLVIEFSYLIYIRLRADKFWDFECHPYGICGNYSELHCLNFKFQFCYFKK